MRNVVSMQRLELLARRLKGIANILIMLLEMNLELEILMPREAPLPYSPTGLDPQEALNGHQSNHLRFESRSLLKQRRDWMNGVNQDG